MKKIIILMILVIGIIAGYDCWKDWNGNVHCNSNGTRVMDCWRDWQGGLHCE